MYGHLYDLDYRNIRLEMSSHHLIYGELDDDERYNWERKVMVAAKRSGCDFSRYADGFQGFAADKFLIFPQHDKFFTGINFCYLYSIPIGNFQKSQVFINGSFVNCIIYRLCFMFSNIPR